MPFVREGEQGRWRLCSTVDLRQLPEERRTKVRFAVLTEFGYTSRPPDGADGTWSRDAVEHVVPQGFVTDLASVPVHLWGVIASYGRQTLPAALHDKLYADARAAGSAARRRTLQRRADVIFLATLRETGAGPVRQWLMWAAVRTFGSPVVVTPLVVLMVVLLTVAVVFAGGWLTAPVIAVATIVAAAAALLAALVVGAVERDARGETGFQPAAFLSLVGACLIALAATPPILVVIVVTAIVRAVVELGERPVVHIPSARAAATARIAWSPLLARLPERGVDHDVGRAG